MNKADIQGFISPNKLLRAKLAGLAYAIGYDIEFIKMNFLKSEDVDLFSDIVFQIESQKLSM